MATLDFRRLAAMGLLVVIAVPLCLVLVSERYFLPMTIFVVGSVPLGIALLLTRGLAMPRSLVLAGMALFVTGLLLSTAVNDIVKPSNFGVQVLRGLGMVWFAYLLAQVPSFDRNWLAPVLLAVVVACGVNAAVNVGYYLAGDPRSLSGTDFRFIPVIGTPRHRWPTTISGTYAIMIVAALAILVEPGRRVWIRAVTLAACVAMTAGLMLTTTRSGYAGALAGVLAVAALRSRRTLLAVGGVVAAILLFAVLYPPALEALAGRGVSYRPGIWLRYISFAWEDPWLGIGVFRRLQLTVYGAEFDHAHNLLISAQIRGGLLGLAGMALMLGGGLYWSWRYARQAGDPIVFGMMLALCVTGMFDYDLALTPLDWVWVTAWLPIGLAAGCELHARRMGASYGAADVVPVGASRTPQK
jgi:hypothetical protein